MSKQMTTQLAMAVPSQHQQVLAHQVITKRGRILEPGTKVLDTTSPLVTGGRFLIHEMLKKAMPPGYIPYKPGQVTKIYILPPADKPVILPLSQDLHENTSHQAISAATLPTAPVGGGKKGATSLPTKRISQPERPAPDKDELAGFLDFTLGRSSIGSIPPPSTLLKKKRKRKRKKKPPTQGTSTNLNTLGKSEDLYNKIAESKDLNGRNKSTKIISVKSHADFSSKKSSPEIIDVSDSDDVDAILTSATVSACKGNCLGAGRMDKANIESERGSCSTTHGMHKGEIKRNVKRGFSFSTADDNASKKTRADTEAVDLDKVSATAPSLLQDISLSAQSRVHRGVININGKRDFPFSTLDDYAGKKTKADKQSEDMEIVTATAPSLPQEISPCTEAEVSCIYELLPKTSKKRGKGKDRCTKLSLSQRSKNANDDSSKASVIAKNKWTFSQKQKLNEEWLYNVSQTRHEDIDPKHPKGLHNGFRVNGSNFLSCNVDTNVNAANLENQENICKLLCTTTQKEQHEVLLKDLPDDNARFHPKETKFVFETSESLNSSCEKRWASMTVMNEVLTVDGREVGGEIMTSEREPKQSSAALLLAAPATCLAKCHKTRQDTLSSVSFHSDSSSSTEVLQPLGKTCLKNVVSVLQTLFGGEMIEIFEVMLKNSFNLLTTVQELQVLFPGAEETLSTHQRQNDTSKSKREKRKDGVTSVSLSQRITNLNQAPNSVKNKWPYTRNNIDSNNPNGNQSSSQLNGFNSILCNICTKFSFADLEKESCDFKPICTSTQKEQCTASLKPLLEEKGVFLQKKIGVECGGSDLSESLNDTCSSSMEVERDVVVVGKGEGIAIVADGIVIEKIEPTQSLAASVSGTADMQVIKDPSEQDTTSAIISSGSCISTEMLEPVGKACLQNVAFALQSHFGGTVMNSFEVMLRNSFNLLTAIYELQTVHLEQQQCSNDAKSERTGG